MGDIFFLTITLFSLFVFISHKLLTGLKVNFCKYVSNMATLSKCHRQRPIGQEEWNKRQLVHFIYAFWFTVVGLMF